MTDTQDKYKLVNCNEVVHIDATDKTTQSDVFKECKIVVPIFQCDTDIDCVEDKETVEVINSKPVIVKGGETFTLDTRPPTRIVPKVRIYNAKKLDIATKIRYNC